MILQIYSVRDDAIGAFMNPFYTRSRGEALRSFQDAVNDPKSTFNSHVTDYNLYYLGEYDDNTGIFTPVPPDHVISANNVKMKDTN